MLADNAQLCLQCAPMDPSTIIDDLGGATAVAKLCECRPQAVSQWKLKGIPKSRLLYLKAIRPDVFEKVSPTGTAGQERGAA